MSYTDTEVPDAIGTVRQVTVLHGHTSPDTAYTAGDYPYGSLRCTIRYWLDTAVKGAKKDQTRFVSQTANPKRHGPGKFGVAPDGHPWNAPKGSTYVPLAFMYLDDGARPSGKQHVHWSGTDCWVRPAYDAQLRLSGAYRQLPEEWRKVYGVYVKISQRPYDGSSWDHWRAALAFITGYWTEHGEWPGYKTVSETPGFYLDKFDYPVAVAQVAAEQDAFARL